MCKIEYADGKRIPRHITHMEILNQIQEVITEAHGQYGIGVLMSSLKGEFYWRQC